jgi:hypothetical protein
MRWWQTVVATRLLYIGEGDGVIDEHLLVRLLESTQILELITRRGIRQLLAGLPSPKQGLICKKIGSQTFKTPNTLCICRQR